jgi:hypothetical protein
MRARGIKPAFFKNEVLAEIPAWKRLLFIGLWCLADREGRLENRPLRIKAELFPYGSEDVRKGIRRLQDAGFLTTYEAGGVGYIEIANFKRHQNPHKQEPPSRIPPSSEGVRKDIGSGSEVLRLTPDSPLLTPDSGLLTPDSAALPPHAFESVWQRYPSKTGMKAATKHFATSVKTMADFLDIQRALDNYLKSDRVKRGFIQNGSTWFNNWRDWINYVETGGSNGTGQGKRIANQHVNETAGRYAGLAERTDKPA